MAMSAAILSSAVCVCDVMNKASVCGKSVSQITIQPASDLCWERMNQYGCTLRTQI